ncbi:hypothetical protein ACNKGT_20140 [Acinetobacter baumannii]
MLNRSVNQVANGRRLAARRVVMNALASIPAQIWRKEVIFNNPAEDSKPLDPLSFEANTLSIQDEPNYKYEYKGAAYVHFDKFNGGYIQKNFSMNNPSDLVLTAQVETFNDELDDVLERIINIPDLIIKEGDLLGLMIYENLMLWFEIVNITGFSLMADFGSKYVLNRRDDLFISPIGDGETK